MQAYDRLILTDDEISINLMIEGLNVNAANHVDPARLEVNQSVKAQIQEAKKEKETLEKEDFVNMMESILFDNTEAFKAEIKASFEKQRGSE